MSFFYGTRVITCICRCVSHIEVVDDKVAAVATRVLSLEQEMPLKANKADLEGALQEINQLMSSLKPDESTHPTRSLLSFLPSYTHTLAFINISLTTQ